MTVRQHRLSDPPYPSDYIYPADKDYPLNEDWEGGPIALLDTSEGLNNQAWHLTYDPTPPPAYDPAMQLFDGVTGYYDNQIATTSGNQITTVLRINRSSFTGGGSETVFQASPDSGGQRCRALIRASDHANVDEQNKLIVIVQTPGPVEVCRLISIADIADGTDHVVFFSYDGDGGAATYIMDEVNADNVAATNRVAPVVGVLGTGTTGFGVGATEIASQFFGGLMGYIGYKDEYRTNYTDFMDGSNPKQINEIVWTQWGGQPAFWKDTGAMDASIGTEGVMTKNGTITEIPPPGGFQAFTVTPEDTGSPVVVLSEVDSVQCGLAFDQNAHVTIVWVDSVDVGHLYWYDTTVGDWIITDFANPVAGVGLTLDDKRNEQTGASDILLWYTLAVDGHHEIYTREQRDRFATVYPMQPGLPVWPYFKKLGMADELRVQMTMTNVGPV